MANLDFLNINISATTKSAESAIENLIKTLGKLDTSLSAVATTANFSSSINTLSESFKNLGSSINSIDFSAFRQLKNTMTGISSTMSNMPNFHKAFAKMGIDSSMFLSEKEQKKLEQIDEQMKWFGGIDKRLTDVGAPTTPKEAWSEYGRTRVNELRGLFRYEDTGNGSFASVNEVIKALDKEGLYQPGMQDVEVWHTFMETIERCRNAYAQLAAQKQELESKGESNALNQVTNNMQNVSTIGEMAGKSISSLAEGLSELQGINVSADQFAGVNQLTRMANTLSVASGESLKGSFDAISNGLTRLSTVQFTNVEPLTATAKAVATFGYQSTAKAGANLASVTSGLQALSGVNLETLNPAKLLETANAIGKFGSAAARHASDNIPRLTVALTEMMNTLSRAPHVSESTVRLAEALSRFSGRASSATSAVNRLGVGLTGLGGRAHRLRLSFGSLASIFGRLYANFFLLIRGARLVGKAVEYSSQMTEAMNVVDVAFGKSADTLKGFMTDSIKQFGLGRLAAAQYASRFQAMGKTMGITGEQINKANEFIGERVKGNTLAYKDLGNSVADMSVNLTKLTADMASLYNQDYDSVAQDMQAIYTGMTRPMRKYGISLDQASMKEFALKNGLDADIASMSQAEKTLLRYQMVMTRASGAMGDFSKTADTWANAMRTVKQLLQEFGRLIGEALINALRPALLSFRNFLYSLIKATENALNAVGKLLGWTKIDFGGASLVEDMEGFADATDDAAGAAKKLKGQLRGIDELNNLTTNPGGGGGGGATDSGTAGGTDLWDKIKETKEKYKSEIESWFELGRRIADKLQDAMSGIDWEAIKQKVGMGARNFASFLNGLFKPEMFAELGRTLAESFNTALTWLYNFGQELDWENVGDSLREGFTNFLDTFDWGLAADTIDTWVQGFADMIASFLKGGEVWDKCKESINEFFGHLDLETVDLIVSAITLIAGARMTVALAQGVLTAIATQITSAISGMVISAALGEVALTAGTIGITAAIGYFTVTKLVENHTGHGFWDVGMPNTDYNIDNEPKSGKKVSPFYHETDMERFRQQKEAADDNRIAIFKLVDSLKELYKWLEKGNKIFWGNPFDAMKKTWLKMFVWFDTDFKPKFEASVDEFFTTIFDFWSNPLEKSGLEKALQDLYNVVKPKMDEFSRKWEEWWTNIFDFWKDPLKAITGKTAEDIGKDIVDGIKKGITDQSGKLSFKALFDNFKNGIKKIFGIQSPAKEMNDVGENIVLGIFEGFDLVDFSAKMSEWWDNNVKPWFEIEKWKTIATNIKTAITAKWNEFVLKWIPSITNWWNNNVVPWFTLEKWKGIADNIRAGIVAKVNELKVWFDGAISGLLSKAQSILSFANFSDIGNNISNALKAPIEGAINALKLSWEGLKSLVSAGLSFTIKFKADTSELQNAISTIAGAMSGLADAGKYIIDKAQEEASKKQEENKGGNNKGGNKGGQNKTAPSKPAGMSESDYEKWKKKNGYALGGFPTIGSLFIAGERGSELVGSINGKTGVASNMEITGIRDAIMQTSSAETQLLRQQNELLQGILQKEFGISSDKLFRSVRNSANDYLMRTGNPAF